MPRLRQAVQLLGSAVTVCGQNRSSAERCTRMNRTLPSALINYFSSGTSCTNPIRRSILTTHFFGCPVEERIENRAAWISCAERPRCHFTISPESGVDPTHETEIIDQSHELSDLDTDKQCVHPGLEVEEQILIEHQVEAFEQPFLSLAELVSTVERREGIADGHKAVYAGEVRLTELELEESHCTDVETQPVLFDAEQVGVSASSDVDVGRNDDRTLELLHDGTVEGDHGEAASLDDSYRGRKYLHVLSVAEVQEVLEKARAKDFRVLDVKGSCEWTDYIVIASGRSSRHLRGMADAIVYKVKQRSHNVGPNLYPLVEGREAEKWMTVDLGNITIHLFLDEARSYYNLEELWTKKSLPAGSL